MHGRNAQNRTEHGGGKGGGVERKYSGVAAGQEKAALPASEGVRGTMGENNRGIKLETATEAWEGRRDTGESEGGEPERVNGGVWRGNYIYKWQFSKTKDLKIARFIRELLPHPPLGRIVLFSVRGSVRGVLPLLERKSSWTSGLSAAASLSNVKRERTIRWIWTDRA